MDKIILMLLDIVVLGALGGAMYYMRSLSSHIAVIREGRSEMQQLLQQLNIHISNAQASIEGMRKLTDDKARIIQKLIDNATAAAEELQFIQKAADNVAQRLERLTGQAAQPVKEEQEGKLRSQTQPNRPMSKAEKELTDAMARMRNNKASGE